MKIVHEKNHNFLHYLYFRLLEGCANVNIIWKKIQIYNISDCKKSKRVLQHYLTTFNSIRLLSPSGT